MVMQVLRKIREHFAPDVLDVPAVDLPFHKIGFHGDQIFLEFIFDVLRQADTFVETGTYIGETAYTVTTHFPTMPVYSCEPNEGRYNRAVKELAPFSPIVRLFQQQSPDFIYQLHEQIPQLRSSLNLYWLDAHGYGYDWPLHDEIYYLTSNLDSGFIAIDDFRIPNQPQFKFDQYKNQVCDLAYVKKALSTRHQYAFAFPNYTRLTSDYHPLVGHVVFAFGDAIKRLPQHRDYAYETVVVQ